ncbi:SulP family inorganic anion transporter [Spirosoma utsteinense]|uniref:MFS superfamily sulfate permease-like transporter n=1 Tax=Spirosoma utsteinense TaxID=2585773 RepID=A0ABR6WDG1_9BACT|nr:SulP family inorganic anion transporter [Spirosoma utsteinense]MBC3785671.1 MFS superfamily sulfate permease-like transporter [Spirosoma utsteinense]MBC3794595.1 MFS superfamily sulfate permease-like transporter [Spirosoma utsteinense]
MQRVNPIRTLTSYNTAWLRQDLPAGLSVFLVALPLCLGIALASGAPLFSGLVAGVIGGIVVGLFSGSEISVSGPAAGLAVIVADAIAKVGSYETFLVAVVLAGAMQLVLGLIKAGRFSSFFPDSVIKGMLVAIGLVIILKQIPHALGRDNDYEGEFEFQQLADGENTISEIYRAIETASTGAVVISGVSLAFLIFWERTAGRSTRMFFKNFPAALVVVFVGIALNEFFRVSVPAWYLGDTAHQHMVQIPTITAGQSLFSIFDFPDFTILSQLPIYTIAATIAVVASLETLLNLEASDRLDPGKRVSSTNQELIAQGIGNMFSGLVGGLPITSVVVRTSANVYGGAKTRISAIIHGVFLLLAVFLGGPLLNLVPLSCLAAVLIMVGYKLAKPTIFKNIYREGWSQFVPFIVTVSGIIFTDLLKGIALGTVVGILYVLYTNFQSTFRIIREGHKVTIEFTKDLYFLSKPQLKEALGSLQPGDEVLIDGSKASFIDHDIYTMLTSFSETAAMQGIRYELRDVVLTPRTRTKKRDLSIIE